MSQSMIRKDPIPFAPDPVIEAYKRDVDRTLLRENLELPGEDRFRKLEVIDRANRGGAQPGFRGQ